MNEKQHDYLIQMFLEQFPARVYHHFSQLLDRPPISSDDLNKLIDEHLRQIRKYSLEDEFLDLSQAEQLARACKTFGAHIQRTMPPEDRSILQAAILYFALDADADHDCNSIIGLDDDSQVIHAVADVLGIELPSSSPDEGD